MIKTSTNASSAAYFLHEQNDFELFVYCMPLWFYEMEGPYASETDYKNAYREKTVHEYGMRSDLSEEDRDKAIRIRLQSYDDYFCLANDAAVQFGWAGDIDDGPDIFHVPRRQGFSIGYIFTSTEGACFVISPVELPGLESRSTTSGSIVYVKEE